MIAPALNLELSELCADVESPHGTIRVSWEKKEDTVRFTAEIPFGTSARLLLPDCIQAEESGTELGSGIHRFTWKISAV